MPVYRGAVATSEVTGSAPPASGGRLRTARLPTVLFVGLAVVLVALGALAGASGPSGPGTAEAVTVSTAACVPDWSLPADGVATFSVTNASSVAVDAELTNRANGDVIGDIRVLGPGTDRPMGVRLAKGTYRFECIYDHVGTRHSGTRSVVLGVPAGTATPEFMVTTQTEMAGPLADYDAYVTSQLGVLQGEVTALSADVTSGNLTQAKTDWVPAELTYDTIGGLYGNIGDLQLEINGTDAGHPRGLTTPTWQGLHRIEYLLWSGQPASAIAPFTADLTKTVQLLSVLWTSELPLTANLLSTRAHEILEDTERDVLSGNDNYGSGTSLEQATADLQGDQVVLSDLRGLLDQRAPRLYGTAEAELHALGAALAATKVDGQWVPLSAITPAERAAIDGAVGQALETLSRVPDLLEVQRFADDVGST